MSEPQMEPNWLDYVEKVLRLVEQGPKPTRTEKRTGDEKKSPPSLLSPVLLFSPHPDDESITGLLPLRLLLEEKRPIINIAVTLGSKKERRPSRYLELLAACQVLGFRCENLPSLQENPDKLFDLKNSGKSSGTESLVEEVMAIIARYRPALVLYPHKKDLHPTHVAVSRMLDLVLKRYSAQFGPLLAAETECWQQMQGSNLAVEGSPHEVAMLCEAIAKHRGEVARNPYHMRQPIRMMENFFRASELISGFGCDCGRVSFAELYTLFRFKGGGKRKSRKSIFLGADEIAGRLFA